MGALHIGLLVVLLPSVAYTSIFGGRTGFAGAAVLIATTAFAAIGSPLHREAAGMSYFVFASDTGCLLALAALAMISNRFWPIWAMGFQTVLVATHVASIWIPDISPGAYQALLSFWNVAILCVMVAGTWKDRRYRSTFETGAAPTG